MPQEKSSADWNATLEESQQELQRWRAHSGLGARALGTREGDWKLWRLGRDWLAGKDTSMYDAESMSGRPGPDVYLASQLYPDGGHTALIGDFVRALDSEEASPHLILTNIHGANSSPLPEEIRSRTAIPAANITFLEGDSLFERLQQLFPQLMTLRPRRLFLFHHPDDPLASVVAHPEIAPQRVLVHHADRTPSFGLHIPGIQIIELNPGAASMSRFLGLIAEWLPLTAPDPGARPLGFLRRGKLVTASTGSSYKFTSDYAYSYPETVAVILRKTHGWHLHIGPLEAKTLAEIESALRAKNLELDRFIHVPWTPSVASCLWEHEVDLYLPSFPIDGARTKVEVMSSATPYLGHSERPVARFREGEIEPEGEMVWNTWEDLASTLERVSHSTELEKQSCRVRQNYEEMHHPRVFAKQLSAILAGEGGREDPSHQERDRRTIQGTLRSLAAAGLHEANNPRAALEEREKRLAAQVALTQALEASWSNRFDKQEKQITALGEQNSRLQEEVKQLRSAGGEWRRGTGLRAKIRRWLLQP